MAYSVLALKDLAELKTRRGNSSNNTIATVLGLNYPTTKAYSVYVWDDASTATCNDIDIVCPNIALSGGRWFKVALSELPQLNCDWNSISGVTQLLNKPVLATVATTGSYADLIDTPFVPQAQIQADYAQTNAGAMDFIKNKPDLSVYYLTSNPAGYITASSTNTLTNKSGNISQWTNNVGYLTTITSSQVTTALGYTPVPPTRNIEINGVTQDLSTNRIWTVGDVFTTTNYSNPPWLTALAWSKITGTPTTLSGYGITDAYPLTGNPSNFLTTITSGQVTSALGYTPVTNARTITINGVTQDLSTNRTWNVGDVLTSGSYADPTWITSLAYSKLTGAPTIPSTTTQISEGTNLYFTNARARAAISLTTTGTGAATYSNTTGVLNIPTPSNSKRIDTYLGTTDASGNYTVTYGTAFSVIPDVQPQLQAGTPSQVVRITSSTTTGFTVNVTNRASANVLGIELLLAATTPVSGASVGVLVVSR